VLTAAQPKERPPLQTVSLESCLHLHLGMGEEIIVDVLEQSTFAKSWLLMPK
jgi:hypothetical protein